MATTNHLPPAAVAPPLGFGILGCAQIARKMQRAIQLAPNAAVVAVGSRNIDKARRFIAETGLPEDSVTPYGSYEEVLDDPRVEAVYLPLPTSLHVRWAVAAAEKGKHVLLEKPAALCVQDLDRILEVCREKRVQFMDGTMWIHHPRTKKMEEVLADPTRFGELKSVHSTFTYQGVYLDVPGTSVFLEDNVRVKPDLDALGALGDAGWYCVGASLWAAGFDNVPITAVALPGAVKNSAGVLLDCKAALHWADGKIATFHCSFLAHFSIQLFALGTTGNIQLPDYVATYDHFLGETNARGEAAFTAASGFALPEKVVVKYELPQEALMVVEFARLAAKIRDEGAEPEAKWPELSRKTQLVIDAVKASIDNGGQPVQIGN